ncbi:MAG: metal ABC transporter permease [Persephonella sp.]|nr:metal ABC transporter permease [Persephonella sp.]
MIDIILPVLLITTVVILMHAYLGIEIIKRQIIFTDLAVGQMAALGVAVSLIFFNEELRYLFSVMFALSTSLLIAYVSKTNRYIEAFIGIVYAFGLSSIFLVMSKSPSGMEHIKELTASDVLYVDFKDVLFTAFFYMILFLILFSAKRYMPEYYDYFYFPVFALTIVHSVGLVGVLVVFVFLIVPAFIGISFNGKSPYLISVITGLALAYVGIFISVYFDFPVGYTLSAVLSMSGIAVALVVKND